MMLSSDPWHRCSSGPGGTVVNYTSFMDPSFLGARMGMKHKEKLSDQHYEDNDWDRTSFLILNESAHSPNCSECSRRK